MQEINELCELLLADNLTKDGKRKLVNYINNLIKRNCLAKNLLKEYIGVLDDVADVYFKNVLTILEDPEVENE